MKKKRILTNALTLMVATLCFTCSAKERGHSHSHAHFEKDSPQGVVEHNQAPLPYDVKQGVKYSKGYVLIVDLTEIGINPSSIAEERREHLSSDHRLLIWEKLKSELPIGTKFALESAIHKKGKLARVEIAPEESKPKITFTSISFIKDWWRVGDNTYGSAGDFKPGLKPYVKPENWTKDSGYVSIYSALSSDNPATVAAIVVQVPMKNNKPDQDAFNQIFLSKDMTRKNLDELVFIGDGLVVREVLLTLERLEAIYADERIVNIIPE